MKPDDMGLVWQDYDGEKRTLKKPAPRYTIQFEGIYGAKGSTHASWLPADLEAVGKRTLGQDVRKVCIVRNRP
jgi:hypothetical protein